MGPYFESRRRRLGIVTLVIACLFTAGWIRSKFKFENVYISPGRTGFGLSSLDGLFGINCGSISVPASEQSFFGWESSEIKTGLNDLVFSHRCRIYADWWGFRVSEFTNLVSQGGRWYLMTVPYWSIVGPMTLLSAWLLLSKKSDKI